jgi:hypothetical protein
MSLTSFPDAKLQVFGVVKAYTTRVGGGAFPTEQLNVCARWLVVVDNRTRCPLHNVHVFNPRILRIGVLGLARVVTLWPLGCAGGRRAAAADWR